MILITAARADMGFSEDERVHRHRGGRAAGDGTLGDCSVATEVSAHRGESIRERQRTDR